MNAKNIRIVSVLVGVVMLLAGFKVKRGWLKVLLCIFGAFEVAVNLLADNKVYEDLEAQINEQASKGMGQL